MVPKKGNGPLAAKMPACRSVLGLEVASLRGKLAILPNCSETSPPNTPKTPAAWAVLLQQGEWDIEGRS